MTRISTLDRDHRQPRGRGPKSGPGGRLAAALALAMLLSLMATSAQAATLDKPKDIVCEPDENADASRVRVVWGDTSTDETGYRVQRSVDGGGFSTLADIAADSTLHVDAGLDDRVFRYRVAALDGETVGPWSDTCRRFAVHDTPQGNIRVYYRPYPAADCPPRSGQSNCVPATTNADGDNETAARMGALVEGTRDALMTAGFDDLSFYDDGKPTPLNLVWCDGGGCAGASGLGNSKKAGMGLAPALLTAFDPTSGSSDPSSVVVAEHEAFHIQQYTYHGVWADPASGWVYEGQARASQDKVCVTAPSGPCISLDGLANGLAPYFGEVNGFLANPTRDLTRVGYGSALFWTYLMEQYGTTTGEPQMGVDVLLRFWEQAAADRDDTGIGTINRMLAELGTEARFRDVFSDFVVANLTKGLDDPLPDTHRYVDESQAPGAYDDIATEVVTLADGAQVGPLLTDLPAWSARYHDIQPDPAVDTLDIAVSQDSANPVFYDLLLIRDDVLVDEIRGSGPDFTQTIANDDYDRVVLVVAGLDRHVNYRWSVNAANPVLSIADPRVGRAAAAGDPADPGKVLVKVDLLESDGDPVVGLDPADIAVTIGTQPVTSVVSSAVVQGQYWLLVQAPTQPGSGPYDLTVEALGLTDTETGAVTYGPRTATDNELVVDRSGSMADDGKLIAAVDGAALYVDTWEADDEAGLVSFNADPSVDEELDPIDDGHRAALKMALGDLTAGGGTAIGDGLLTALDQLVERGDEGDDWTMVVLSDGMETADERIPAFLARYRERRDAGEKLPRVHTIALGPDADRGALQALARDAGGTYQFAALPDTSAATAMAAAAPGPDDASSLQNRLPSVYRVISEEVAGEQQVMAVSGPLGHDPAEPRTFTVDGGASQLTVAMTSDFAGLSGRLLAPDGSEAPVTRSETDHAFWRVDGPAAGTWTLVPGIACSEFCPTEYAADAAVHSTVTMDVALGLAPEERLAGRPMPILTTLSDAAAITGATVEATVRRPDGTTDVLSLFDDGNHGDGAAGDGFYGALYRDTHDPGSHVVTVSAEGTSASAGAFTRRQRLSFDMAEGADGDGDGLPDWWERLYGTDPGAADAGGDPDGDGLPSGDEYRRGTDPLDADSDDGGEADGSETGDPLDPTDDRLPAPTAVAHPLVGEVEVRYTTDPAHTGVRIARGPAPEGPFTVLSDGGPADGAFLDGEVTNGVLSCYVVTGMGAGGARSAPSDPTCATPSADPVAPDGFVRIDGGADATFDRDVMLELVAVDNPSPHVEHIGDEPRAEDAVESGVTEMLISNDGSFDGATWEPYAPTAAWMLASDTDLATVYVRYRDAAGNESRILASSIRVLDLSTCDITGSDGSDHLTGTAESEVICAGGGNDQVDGGGGTDAIIGGPGNDHLDGGPGNDLLLGGDGNDRLRGQGGDDTLRGQEGNDRLEGGPGMDELDGGPGNDQELQ